MTRSGGQDLFPGVATSRTSRPPIVLTGFMGTGKTEVGRLLAEMLGCDFTDTDRLIEARTGRSVAEIFARDGEPHFRALERDLCRELAGQEDVVVATGGGTLLDPENRALLARRGRIILLEASVEEILERTRGDRGRPLMQAGELSEAARAEYIRTILRSRAEGYGAISERVDTTGRAPRDVAERIAVTIELPRRTAILRMRDRTTTIETGRGLLAALGARLRAHGLGRRIFLLAPPVIGERFLPQITASLAHHDLSWETIAVRDGDREKTLAGTEAIIDALAARGAGRDAVAVAVGGGVTGDLVGFAAAIYMRGIDLVQVPTTLLAQADSSIGGKAGVNHARAKNLIGSFHPARLVLSDPCVLRSLPDREIASGMAEVIKTAIIGAPGLFDFLERELPPETVRGASTAALRDPALLERCVADCAAVKSAIVEGDPFESGERRVLNLGHTLGHALESVGGHALTHGEAVAVGLVAALRIALRRGQASEEFLERTRRLLVRCGLPVRPPAIDLDALAETLRLDKKRRNGRPHTVLPLRPGTVIVTNDVGEQEMLAALREAAQ